MNNELFSTQTSVPVADTTNEAGGVAYALNHKEALAQMVCTGTFNETYYDTADNQLEKIMRHAASVEDEFLAACAVYGRTQAHMKDTAALLTVLLSLRGRPDLFRSTFRQVIKTPKMLRNFVQIMRSGVTGRKSFGSGPRAMVRELLTGWTPEQLLRAKVGNSPGLGDIIKMVHPKPRDAAQAAMFAYLIGKPFNMDDLPVVVRDYIKFCTDGGTLTDGMLTALPARLLTREDLSVREWQAIALNAGWTATRMNLNSYARHGVFEGPLGGFVSRKLAEKLADPVEVKRSGMFPYQLLTAFMNLNEDVPSILRDALEQALEVSIEGVELPEGRVAVLVDTSGSMNSPATGYRRGATSSASCVDIAALMAATFLRKKGVDNCRIIPFDTVAHQVNPGDLAGTVMETAAKLARYGGGGTAISRAFQELRRDTSDYNLVVLISDNESWFDQESPERRWAWSASASHSTTAAEEWRAYRQEHAAVDTKLVCIDIAPYDTTQVATDPSVMNLGGFGEATFDAIKTFCAGESEKAEHWVSLIQDGVRASLAA